VSTAPSPLPDFRLLSSGACGSWFLFLALLRAFPRLWQPSCRHWFKPPNRSAGRLNHFSSLHLSQTHPHDKRPRSTIPFGEPDHGARAGKGRAPLPLLPSPLVAANIRPTPNPCCGSLIATKTCEPQPCPAWQRVSRAQSVTTRPSRALRPPMKHECMGRACPETRGPLGTLSGCSRPLARLAPSQRTFSEIAPRNSPCTPVCAAEATGRIAAFPFLAVI